MKHTVFYAWQSDSPNKTNRGLIRDAVDRAVKAITPELSPGETVDVHEAARGMPGSPDIPTVIFERIADATAIVADVTFIGEAGKRATPNPNVLVEVGYALGTRSHERVVLVQNTVHLADRELPFDIRNRQVLKYNAHEDDKPAEARKALVGMLTGALRAVLEHDRALGDPVYPFSLSVREGEHGTHRVICEVTNQSDRRIDDWELTLRMPMAPFSAAHYGHGGKVDRRSDAQTAHFETTHEHQKAVAVGDSRVLAVTYVVDSRVHERCPDLRERLVTATLSVDGRLVRKIERRFGDLHPFDAAEEPDAGG